ncbi:hypothetical protein, partial [Lysobacter sp. TAB13]|uniref:hypothetical protein n=1 Tax=Lysobacter sp. TAB13 TaxID=3233065 RepID=UPI003F9EAB10
MQAFSREGALSAGERNQVMTTNGVEHGSRGTEPGPMRQSMFRGKSWLAAAGIAVALAGCDTVSNMGSQSAVAEIDAESSA